MAQPKPRGIRAWRMDESKDGRSRYRQLKHEKKERKGIHRKIRILKYS